MGRIIMMMAAVLVSCKVIAPWIPMPVTETEFDISVVAALAMLITGDVLNLG